MMGVKTVKAKTLTRGAGVLLPISSLPSAYGIGTLGNAAFRFVDLLVELKQKYWQILPMGPLTVGDSPFQSISLFAGNPYYIDLDALIEEGLLQTEEVRAHRWGDSEEHVDYAVLYENRYAVLQKAFDRFDEQNEQYIAFCRKNREWLEDYSLYMAIKTDLDNEPWYSWKDTLKNRQKDALDDCRRKLADQIDFWKFCQYEFYRQWNALKSYAAKRGIQMIGDMPFYVAYDSVDVWTHRKLFQLDQDGRMLRVAACPPDAFSREGQIWGNPVYDWAAMEEDNFDWWKARMKQQASLFDVIKIDHFLGMVKYFSLQAGETDINAGRWLKGPGRKLADILEKAAGEKIIIAENMGTVLPGVSKLIQKLGWPDMKVLLFAFDGKADNEYLPHNYKSTNTVVYAGTHDNDTIVGYFRDRTDYELAYLYSYLDIDRKEQIPDALIRAAYSSIADVVILQMQDVLQLGNEARMNQPSTVGANWKWRILEDTLPEERRNWIRTQTALFRR
ncbi:MAG: 4-alpha-glucanotransferase [Lachnospiraceae bacterium]|nr:4-alpha-glucanotransferase [Lachnospiraceae bacterium]